MFDHAAERAVLAGIFTYGSVVYDEISGLVTVSTFHLDSNQAIFKCLEHILKDMPDAKPDYPSIISAAHSLKLDKFFSKSEETNHLRGIMLMPVKQENVRKLAAKIKKLEMARELSVRHDEAKNNLIKVTGDESPDKIIAMSETPILEYVTELAMVGNEGPKQIGVGVKDYFKFLAEHVRDTVGISTGYKEFDKAIGGGLRKGTVNVIGARPKQGKTQHADNVCLYVAGVSNYPVLNCDTEMTKEDHWHRMAANLSGVPVDEIETGKFAKDSFKKKKVYDALDKIEKMPYDYLSIAGQPFEETIAMIRRWLTKRVGLDDAGVAKPHAIVFDYLKLMSTDILDSKNIQEYQALGFMMTELHNLMNRFGGRCLAYVQLNRDGVDRESTDVVSQSDRIIWLCSNFSILKKKSDEEMAEQVGSKIIYNRKLVNLAARHGGGLDDGDYINMYLNGSIARLIEGPTKTKLNLESRKVQGTTDDIKFGD